MSNEDIRARLVAATPRPWTCRKQRWGKEPRFKVQSEGEDLAIIAITLYEDQQKANGKFMAHAPTDIAKLLAKLDAVEKALEHTRIYACPTCLEGAHKELCPLEAARLTILEGE